MSRRWDEYVEFEDPLCKIMVRIRCYGPGTANAIADEKRRMGFDKVKIVGRPASRRKDRNSVLNSSIQRHVWSRGVH